MVKPRSNERDLTINVVLADCSGVGWSDAIEVVRNLQLGVAPSIFAVEHGVGEVVGHREEHSLHADTRVEREDLVDQHLGELSWGHRFPGLLKKQAE